MHPYILQCDVCLKTELPVPIEPAAAEQIALENGWQTRITCPEEDDDYIMSICPECIRKESR